MSDLPNLAHLQPVDGGVGDWRELRAVIESAIIEQPRSQQVRIGPSELGVSCDACLVSKLAGMPEQRGAAWLPYVGTAVHEQLGNAFAQANSVLAAARWLIETTVSVGEVGGVDITGHADLFDLHTGTVTDWKIVGATTLRSVKAGGPTPTYRTQGHLYGRGFARRGLKVERVQIAYLPRNSPDLSQAVIWSETYDEQIATAALERADRFARWIEGMGLDATLAATGGHSGDEHSCARFDPTLNSPGHRQETFADLLAG